MKKFITFILAAIMMIGLFDISFAEPYIEMGVIYEVNTETGVTTILDAEDRLWEETDIEYEVGDIIYMVMEDNQTDEVAEDDIILMLLFYGENALKDPHYVN